MDDSPFHIDTSSESVPRTSKKGDPDRGQYTVIVISISMILLEGITFLLDKEPHIVRWLLTGGLIYGLIFGVEWVRYLTALLYLLGCGFALYAAVSVMSPMLFVLAAFMGLMVFFLTGSRHVSAFYREQNGRSRLTSSRPSE